MLKMTKLKPVNYILIDEKAEPEAYEILDEARYEHGDVGEAKIGLAWRKNVTPNQDDQIELGKCTKVSDLQREFIEYDFIIVLNRAVWSSPQWDRAKKLALLDHELCHAAVSLDEDGEVKYNERGRPVYRIRKHDVQEFHENVVRHGCYKLDLEIFAKAICEGPGLFDEAITKSA